MLDGDARYYYHYLQSTFIHPLLSQSDWLNGDAPVSHHPAGLAVLWLPFFLAGHVAAILFHQPLTGFSLPYQAAIAVAALSYAMLGLVYLRRLLSLNGIPEKVVSLILPLTFLGTNLLHYTLHEAGMSHVYSFFLITAFMYYSCRYVKQRSSRDLYLAAAFFGIVLLVRLNNAFALLTIVLWFTNTKELASFFKDLLSKRSFYTAVAISLCILCLQPLIWLWKEDVLFINRYAPYGFYWTHPALLQMLFGFNAGFFIYAPLCLLFLGGLALSYARERFFFYASAGLLLVLFYFFSAYSAYTYYDGIGIRVLVDYYALFALFGAKLFTALISHKALLLSAGIVSLALLTLNFIYAYQSSHHILLRSGMTYRQWKYIFLHTGKAYEQSLGGCHDLRPYAKEPVPVSLSGEAVSQPFSFAGKEFGPTLRFAPIAFQSKRIAMNLHLARTEAYANASRDALVCAVLEDSLGRQKSYQQFRLNETPATHCCEEAIYNYEVNMEAPFRPSDRLSIYLWNLKKQAFSVNAFSVNVYNYNY